MIDILERIKKLIALSASPNQNEARNAAWKACRLIRENRVYLVKLKEPVQPNPSFENWETVVDENYRKKSPPPPYNKPQRKSRMQQKSFDSYEAVEAAVNDYKRAGYEISATDQTGVTMKRAKDGSEVRLDVPPARERRTSNPEDHNRETNPNPVGGEGI